MKGIKWLTLSLLAGYLLSCDSLKNDKGKAAFYYFPDKNIYYDIDREVYIFSLDSGKTWDSLPSNTEIIPAVLGEKKTINSNTDPVWANNKSDREQYDGKLFNVINEETLKPAQTENKPVTKARTTKPTSENDKKKRPIKKFFEKLFGKKKRD